MLAVSPPASTAAKLLEEFRAGRIGALARAISWVENGDPAGEEVLDALYAETGRAWRTGVTGPPGAGKSTLVGALAARWSAAGRRTALLAVDPSSPLTGGALLGDRVRVERAVAEHGVFVRSMASRGTLGGLARAAGAAADLMDAFGFAEILLETVGVGQAEVDIAAAADTTVVVLTPTCGDGVQAMKAGLLEVADLLVVNKADLGGAERLQVELESALDLRAEIAGGGGRPEVLLCAAENGAGVDEVLAALERRREADRQSGRLETLRQARALARVRRLVAEGLRRHLWEEGPFAARARAALAAGRRPDRVAEEILRSILEELQG